MSSQPFRARFGPFKGLTSAFGAYATPADAKVSQNVDTLDGTIQGLFGPGSIAEGSEGTARRFLHMAPEGFFIVSDEQNWACDDAIPEQSGRLTYRTNQPGLAAATKARALIGTTDYQLGMLAPTSSPTSSGGSGGSCRYVVTYYCSVTKIESNPDKVQGQGVTGLPGATLNSLPVYSDAYDSERAATVYRRIYRTQENDPDGILYYCTEITNNTATTTGTTPTAVNTARPLDWGAGGTIDNDVLPYDHSPAPSLTVLSDSLHSVNEGQGAPGSGILFGAVDSWLTWSRVGYPMYWPTVNWFRLGERINAIISWNAQTFAFTDSSVYAASGVADYALSITKTGARVGVSEAHAKSVVQTPHGIIYLSREGVVLFDGNGVQNLSDPFITRAALWQGSVSEQACAAFFDGFYFLAIGATCYVFDLRRLSDIRLTTTADEVTAFTVTPFSENSRDRGLYLIKTDGHIRPWRPLEGASVGGSTQQAWIWESPALTLGESEKSKRFMRCQVEAEGAVTLSFFIGDETEPRFVKESASGLFWVAKSLQGKSLRVRAEGAGDARLVNLEVRGEVRRV